MPLKRPRMQRGVSQLLFNYLPGRTVDWEDGLAIVQLGSLRLSSAWEVDRMPAILEEISELFARWRARGGKVDVNFPDPKEAGRFTVGPPEAIEAHFLETALACARCSRLVFRSMNELTLKGGRTCPACGEPRLRQIPQVFVHGCGELVPVSEWLPGTKKNDDESIHTANRPLKCLRCGPLGELYLPSRTERVKDMRVVCRRCDTQIVDRFTARCHRCLKKIQKDESKVQDGSGETIVTRIAMRMTRYSASDTYYPQTLTILRLDRPTITATDDSEADILRRILPLNRRPTQSHGTSGGLMALVRRLKDAELAEDKEQVATLKKMIANAALGSQTISERKETGTNQQWSIDDRDLERAVYESLAFRQNVTSRDATSVAEGSVSAASLSGIERVYRHLGLREVRLVDDLPVITATFGYTRRSFEPTYEELGAAALPTTIRPFPSIDERAARRIQRPENKGTVPILARESEHEGVFFALDFSRVLRWLSKNGISIGGDENDAAIVRILKCLEPVDRYYDNIWQCKVRRYVFGLVHTMSHAVMRAASRFAGIERTSISEYVFLPLLGAVVFDNSSSFRLGGMENMIKDQLPTFLESLSNDSLDCVYDPECVDYKGACHGCVHSPEISCRVFNHGLSRAFLIGGHAPWSDVASTEQVVGYWQIEP